MIRKGTAGVSTNGIAANLMFFDRGTFWVLQLTYLYLPKSARAYLFPQSVKNSYLCSGPISVDPICPQPSDRGCGIGLETCKYVLFGDGEMESAMYLRAPLSFMGDRLGVRRGVRRGAGHLWRMAPPKMSSWKLVGHHRKVTLTLNKHLMIRLSDIKHSKTSLYSWGALPTVT